MAEKREQGEQMEFSIKRKEIAGEKNSWNVDFAEFSFWMCCRHSSSTTGACLRLFRSISVLCVSVSILCIPISLLLSWVLASSWLPVLTASILDDFTIFTRPFVMFRRIYFLILKSYRIFERPDWEYHHESIRKEG